MSEYKTDNREESPSILKRNPTSQEDSKGKKFSRVKNQGCILVEGTLWNSKYQGNFPQVGKRKVSKILTPYILQEMLHLALLILS